MTREARVYPPVPSWPPPPQPPPENDPVDQAVRSLLTMGLFGGLAFTGTTLGLDNPELMWTGATTALTGAIGASVAANSFVQAIIEWSRQRRPPGR